VGYDKNAIQLRSVDKQDEEKKKLHKLLSMSVNEIELSVRAANCLNNANITTVVSWHEERTGNAQVSQFERSRSMKSRTSSPASAWARNEF